VISLAAVSKRYLTPAGEVNAVDGISLEVEAGTSLAITGPSGCGKSTLLGLIAGLEDPSEGRVSINGEQISGLPDGARARRRRDEFGFVFQSDNLAPFLTAVENVSLQLALSDAGADVDRPRELLLQLGLGSEADKLPDQLSGGQRQRVAVARALIHRPSVLLADEPTGALDEGNSAAVIDVLLAAQRDTGATLVVVTHDPEVARRLDRTIRMSDGQLTADA
jgi:putative ABC transport system ATP-binding protein